MTLLSRFSYKSFNARISSRNTAASIHLVCATTHLKDSSSHVDGIPKGLRLVRDITSLVDQQARDYISNLQDLRRSLLGQAGTVAAVMVYRVFDKLEDLGKRTSSILILF